MLKSALVVDNNEVILKLLVNMLQRRGLQVFSARDGLSALEVLIDYHPDIIFTDLIMPNIGGEKLCRIINNRKKFSSTLLIVVSAIAIEDNVDFGAFGAHACITKGPAREMAANIDTVLSLARKGRIDALQGMRLGGEHVAQRSATKELLAAKRHLQLILNNIDNGFLEFSPSERIVNCNSFASQLFGKSEISILTSNIRNLFSGDALTHVSECLDAFHAARLPVESMRSVKVRGNDIVFKFLEMAGGKDSSTIMIIKDVTREKEARLKLKEHLEHMEKLVAERTRSYEIVNRELERKIAERQKMNEELEFVARQWSNTFDTISDFVSVHDKDMRLVRVNKSLAEFLGKAPDDLLGRHCYEVIHGGKQPWPNCPHVAAIKNGKTITFEVDDKYLGVPLLVTCTPLLHDDGSVLGSVHVARDISDQKNAAALREQLIRQLEESLSKVKLLSGFIPICASCKKIRDDKGYWQQVEEYIRNHSEAEFSHSICPGCARELYSEIIDNDKL